MTTTLLDDPFGHHAWANERLLEACVDLTPEQLSTSVPGTYGTILDTFRHLVSADAWYLSLIGSHGLDEDPEKVTDLAALSPAIATVGSGWRTLLAGGVDPDQDVVDVDDGQEFRYPVSILLAQMLHHGTDHRSQICTALTNLGITPPGIDVWAYAEATGRSSEAPAPTA